MDSQDLKIATLSHLLFNKKFLGTFTESFNGSDVLGVSTKMVAWEFEIKVSKEDLAKELKAIRFLVGTDTNMRRARGANKLLKHATYLGHEYGYKNKNYFVPSYFSFVVPFDIVEYTTRAVEGTPYGVYSYADHDITCVVTPQKLTENLIDKSRLLRLLRKSSTESYFLRRKLKDLTK